MSAESESAAVSVVEDVEVDGAEGASTRGRGQGRGRGRGQARGDGRGRGRGNGRGRGRGGSSHHDDGNGEGEGDNDVDGGDESGRGGRGRGRGRGRGEGRGRGRGNRGNQSERRLPPLKPVAEPNTEQYYALSQAYQTKRTALNSQINALTAKIDPFVRDRKAVVAEINAATRSLNDITQAKVKGFETLALIQSKVDEAISSKDTFARLSEQLHRDLPGQDTKTLTVAAFDAFARGLERQLGVRGVPVAHERKLLDEIRRLKAIRPAVAEYERLNAFSSEDAQKSLQAQQATQYQEAYEWKSKEEVAAKKVAELKNKESKILAELDPLVAQRRALIDERLNEERVFEHEKITFEKAKAEYEAYAARLKTIETAKADYEKRKAQAEAREARKQRYFEEKLARAEEDRIRNEERERSEIESDPYEEHHYIIEELLKYLHKISPHSHNVDSDKSEPSPTGGLVSQRNAAFKTGGTLDSKKGKKDPLFESVVAPSKEKKKPVQATNKVLTHAIAVLDWFQRVQVSPPMITTQIEDTVKVLKAREEFYKEDGAKKIEEKRARWEEKMRKQEEEEAAQYFEEEEVEAADEAEAEEVAAE